MDEIHSGNQIIRFDRDLTRTAYSGVPSGDAERCGCLYCLNFAAQRSSVYPDEFRSLLERIGIDPEKEGEVYEVCPEEDLRIYGGWFYLAGEVAKIGERKILSQFEFWFADARGASEASCKFRRQSCGRRVYNKAAVGALKSA